MSSCPHTITQLLRRCDRRMTSHGRRHANPPSSEHYLSAPLIIRTLSITHIAPVAARAYTTAFHMDAYSGDVCEATGVYESACRCQRLTLIVAGSILPCCAGCQREVWWMFLYEEFIPRLGPLRAAGGGARSARRRVRRG